MRESTNNFVTKKHQDMEENNIQETQHRDAQQMRVDEFATMLGQVRQGNKDLIPQVLNALLEDGDLQGKFLDMLEAEDKQWLLALDNLKADCIVLAGMYREKCRYYDELFTDEDTGEEVVIERTELIDGTSWFERNKDEARALYVKICAADLPDADVRMVVDWVDATPFNEMAIVEKKKRQMEEQVPAHELGLSPLYGWICEVLGDAYYYGEEHCGYYIDIAKAREYYAKAQEIKHATGDETFMHWDNPIEDFDEKDWEEYVVSPETRNYSISGPAQVLDKVRATIDKLTEKYGMPGNEFGRYVPTPILLQALLGIKSKAPNYWGNLLFMEDQPDGTLSLTMEVELGHVWPHVLEQGFPGTEVKVEKE